MINNNKFFIKNLKNVVFLGENKNLTNFININKSLNIKTLVITTSSQKLKIDKSINYKVFDKINNDFKNFIKKSLSIKNTLFISIAARYIFKKDTIKKFFLNNLVNIHNARLPLDSGGGGYSWKILREDRIDNQTIHLIDEKIDHGPIIFNISSVVPKGVQTPLDFDIFSEIVEDLKKDSCKAECQKELVSMKFGFLTSKLENAKKLESKIEELTLKEGFMTDNQVK